MLSQLRVPATSLAVQQRGDSELAIFALAGEWGVGNCFTPLVMRTFSLYVVKKQIKLLSVECECVLSDRRK